jgi:hypothetical protein
MRFCVPFILRWALWKWERGIPMDIQPLIFFLAGAPIFPESFSVPIAIIRLLFLLIEACFMLRAEEGGHFLHSLSLFSVIY